MFVNKFIFRKLKSAGELGLADTPSVAYGMVFPLPIQVRQSSAQNYGPPSFGGIWYSKAHKNRTFFKVSFPQTTLTGIPLAQ